MPSNPLLGRSCRSKSSSGAQSLFIFIMASSHHLFHDDGAASVKILHEKSSFAPRILHNQNQHGNHADALLKSLKS